MWLQWGEKRNACIILVGKSIEKVHLGDLERDGIKMDVRQVVRIGGGWN
jgi:hypothetical protein